MAGFDRADALVTALAAGKPVIEAAALAGMSERSAWRRIADPDVPRAVRELRTRMVERAVGRLTDGLSDAVDTLRISLTSETEAIRLRAATAILDQAAKWRVAEELDQRVAALEAALAGQEERHGAA